MIVAILLLTVWTIIVIAITLNISRSMRLFSFLKSSSKVVSIDELPTVSVCIPARNETHAMTECLESVLASDYPKFEVIVADDGSGDSTSNLIKSFAHAGVRFVEGRQLQKDWLGKNQALQGLLDESSGEMVMFMDVDTNIDPYTISKLVAYAQQEKASMVSVLPRRYDSWRASVLLAPLRYFWVVATHTKRAPAVASALWMIDSDILQNDLGGFKNLKHYIQPEAYLAQYFSKIKKYRALVSSPELNVTYAKKLSSQIETSIRLLYPLVGMNWRSGVVATCILLAMALPGLIILSSVFFGWGGIQIAAVWVELIMIAMYAPYCKMMFPENWLICSFMWPILIIQELALLMISWYKYTRGNVTWKGRNISKNPKLTV
ncbi:MAG: glycosyltransferase [bacterium]|nr:glycosyltransferase [bacterium]MDN5835339.1 glycosyltransferase [bacterium]